MAAGCSSGVGHADHIRVNFLKLMKLADELLQHFIDTGMEAV